MSAHVSIIVPTFNESANVNRLINAVERALANIRWEIIFVDDDSPDATAQVVKVRASQDAKNPLLA